MKRVVFLLSIISFLIHGSSNAQNPRSGDNNAGGESADKTSINNIENRLVINLDMIERFNNTCQNSVYLTWRDLIPGYDMQSLKDFYYAYINCDIENESLHDIKLALEQKKIENDKIIQQCKEEYLARYKNLKIRINIPDSSQMIVQKLTSK